MSDEQLDKMLTEYFAREPKVAFSIFRRFERSSGGAARRVFIAIPAVCAAFALICSSTFVYRRFSEGLVFGVDPDSVGTIGSNDDYNDAMCVTSTAEEKNSFILRAFADTVADDEVESALDYDLIVKDRNKPDKLDYGKIWYAEDMTYWYDAESGENLGMFPAEQSGIADSDTIVEPAPFYYVTVLRMYAYGDNIDYVTVECNGKLSYNDTSEGPVTLYPKTHGQRTFAEIRWLGPKELLFDGEDIGESKDTAKPERDDLIALREKRRALFENITADGYNEYFGDTVTVTAFFSDGTSSVGHIYISFDDDGNYIIDYD